MAKRGKLEVHEHSYITGPNARISGRKLVHSHEGGDQPHEHEHTGPGSYTIDKDAWFRATGLKGGGRKKFTAKPTGEQLTVRVVAAPTFEVIVLDSAITTGGPGIAPIARLEQACGARVSAVRSLARKVAS